MYPASKRKRTDEDVRGVKKTRETTGTTQLDLLYPFSGNTTDDSDIITPPFISAEGPLYEEGGILKLRLTSPITKVDGGVGLSIGNGLETTQEGALQVKVNSEGPIESTEEGLNVRVDDTTVEIDEDWKLSVKLDPKGCIDYTANGLSVNVDDTLIIERDSVGQTYELGVHLNPDGPITADENGVDLEVDNTLVVNQSGGQGVLGAKLQTDGGLSASSTGIGIKLQSNSGLSLESGLGVKVAQNGLISRTSDGLVLRLDSAGPLSNTNDGLALTSNPPLSVTNSTLQLNTASGSALQVSGNALTIKTNSNSCILSETAGLALRLGNNSGLQQSSQGLSLKVASAGGLQTTNGELAVKVKSAGGIGVSTDGLYVDMSISAVTLSSGDYDFGVTTVETTNYGVFNCLTYSNFVEQGSSDTNTRVWKAKCKLDLVSFSGMVTGSLYLRWYPGTSNALVWENGGNQSSNYLITFYLSGKPSLRSASNTAASAHEYTLSTVNPSGLAGCLQSKSGNYFVPAQGKCELVTMSHRLTNNVYTFMCDSDEGNYDIIQPFYPNTNWSEIKFEEGRYAYRMVLCPPISGVQEPLLAVSFRVKHPKAPAANRWVNYDSYRPGGAFQDVLIPIMYHSVE